MTRGTLAQYLSREAPGIRFKLGMGGLQIQNGVIEQAAFPLAAPLVSCLMVTRGALFPARFALDCFLRQTYAARELVVVCDAPGTPLEEYCRALGDARIRFVYADGPGKRLGELRNLSLQAARGDWVCQWDDDDLYHPSRLQVCMATAQGMQAHALFLTRWLLWSPLEQRFAVSSEREWEGSMLAQKRAIPPYPALSRGEDTEVAHAILTRARVLLLDAPWLYSYIQTGRNTWSSEHFKAIWATASHVDPAQQYGATMAALQASGPYAEYAAACAGQEGS